jgi:hypothetical protein
VRGTEGSGTLAPGPSRFRAVMRWERCRMRGARVGFREEGFGGEMAGGSVLERETWEAF